MSEPLRWFYAYSPRYEALHHMLKDTIQDSRIALTPLFVDQSEFSKTTYQDGTHHFFCGCFIKQEMILHILKKMPTGSYFLFTDVDLVVLNQHKLYDFFQTYISRQVDMVYMHEGQNADIPYMNCNVGFALLRVSEKTIAYFEEVMRQARESVDKFDMEIMQPLFRTFPGTIETFDPEKIVLSNQVHAVPNKNEMLVVQLLCGNNKDYKMNMMQKYMGAKAFSVPIEKYLETALRNGRTPDEIGVILKTNP